MKKISLILIALLLVTSLNGCLVVKRVKESIAEPSTGGFVPNLPDVPLPKHFVVDADTSTFFDSAEGRIAEINAQGFGEVEDVEAFYGDTMAQFGWQKITNNAYKKEGELLMIGVEKGKTLTSIKFQLRPSL